jgi:digeranylgeranylglycerophospholipid reductase
MIAIVGAGPAGCRAGFFLAKAGYDVKIFEDHNVVGSPVQCTGVLTSTVSEILPPSKDYFVNEISRIEVIAPDDNSVELKLKKKEYIYSRTKFDNYLAKLAQDAGCEVLTGHRFVGYDAKSSTIKLKHYGQHKEFKIERLIGADGPLSPVAKSAGMYGKREFFIGAQAVVKMKNDPSVYKTYFGSVCPDLFAWAVPENEQHVRLGLADRKNPNALFQLLMKRLGVNEIVEWQGGLIPIYNPKLKTQSKDGKVLLVGDAATQVKATTAGGIIQAMTAAEIAAKSIVHGLDYDDEWRKKLGKELWLHLMIRKLLDRFDDADYNRLIKTMQQDKVKDILENKSRDRPLKLLAALMLAKPSLARYGLKILNKSRR